MKSSFGFILSLDSLLALVIAGSMILIILELAPSQDYGSIDYLHVFLVDSLTVAEKDGSLRDAVGGDASSLNDLLFSQPEFICLNLSIYDDQDNLLFTNSTSCNPPSNNVLAKRSFVRETSFYLAELEGWYK